MKNLIIKINHLLVELNNLFPPFISKDVMCNCVNIEFYKKIIQIFLLEIPMVKINVFGLMLDIMCNYVNIELYKKILQIFLLKIPMVKINVFRA